MLLTLRSYQTECVAAIWNYFRTKFGNPVCALPTGTGKSIVIAAFLESVYKQYPRQKILVMTHVKELIQQNYEELLALWPAAPAGIYSAGLNRRDVLQKIIFAGIASVAKRAHEFGLVDLVLVDECHLISPNDATMYQRFFAQLKVTNPHLKIIGFTATAWRLGHGRITDEGGIFSDTCFDITTVEAFNRLIAEDFLSPLVPKPMTTLLNVDGVHMQGGEFKAGELQAAVDKIEITRAILRESVEYKDTRKHWLIFASGVDHAVHIADELNLLGVSCKAVHSKMPSAERDRAIDDFKAGRIQALSNNNILTTGFNSPWIDLIVCARPTASSVLWVQMLGRGTRPYPGKKNCLVLDFAGNTQRLGPINDPVIPNKKGKGGGEAPVKVCPVCDCYVHASKRFCDGIKRDDTPCTHEFVFETKLKVVASSDELIRGDLPIVETFRIEHINYTIHTKEGMPSAMKLAYYCGFKMFSQYVCVEHANFAGKKARDWLRERLPPGATLPTTTAEALARAQEYLTPTHMMVWTNRKYPEIVRFCFDGTAFGKEADTPVSAPTIETYNTPRPISAAMLRHQTTPIDDDDIPF
jgi:DNA repair protein RadD